MLYSPQQLLVTPYVGLRSSHTDTWTWFSPATFTAAYALVEALQAWGAEEAPGEPLRLVEILPI